MIHTITGEKTLNFKTPLIEYIKENNLYNNERLMYTKKYTEGTFSIMNPTTEYKNCLFVNGYPHFKIPFEICLEEIKNFIYGNKMYDYDFVIRYGDTHPHKPIPKLGQIRNLLIENSFSSLISGNNNITSYYGLGDISIKTLGDFLNKNSIQLSAEDLFKLIVNDKLSEDIEKKLLQYDKDALIIIKNFLKNLDLNSKEFIIESSLYKNQDLYKSLKNDSRYQDQLKKNGELKYSLQEVMFINFLMKTNNSILFSIIGDNQVDHVLKVSNILKDSNTNLNARFLTYGICKNAESRDVEEWTNYFEKFINDNNFKILGNKISVSDLLKIITISINNDNILDFGNLNKYLRDCQTFCNLFNSFRGTSSKDNIDSNNDLINQMALVCYNLNRSIELGNQTNFYKYLLGIVKEYEQNKEKYSNIKNLYYEFVNTVIKRLGFRDVMNDNIKIKELKI